MSFIFLCSLITTADAQETKEKDSGHTKQKALMLEKKIFNAQKTRRQNQLILEKANVLKEAGFTNDARKAFARISYKEAKDEYAFVAMYNLALLNYSQNNFDQAARYLSNIEFYIPDYADKPKVLLLNVLVHNVKEKFDIARESLEQYVKGCKEDLDIDSVYSFKAKMKEPAKAKRLSGYIPGLGQFYAGKPWKGINSFLLNAGFLGYATYCGFNKLFFSAVFTGLEFFASFYSGGKRNAQSIVRKENTQYIKNLNHFLIKWSESCYPIKSE